MYSAKNQYGQIIAIKCKKELADAELMEKSKLLFRDELEALYNLNQRTYFIATKLDNF